MSWGKSFHSFGAAASKAMSPSLVLTLGGDKRILIVRSHMEHRPLLKVIRLKGIRHRIMDSLENNSKDMKYNSRPNR